MKDEHWHILALIFIIGCFFVAGAVRSHEAVVVDVPKTNAALRYACTGFVDQLVNDGKVVSDDREVSIDSCINILAERFEAKPYLHNHT